MTERRLEAPHRRLESTPPRIVERLAIVAYQGTAAVLAHVPPRLSRAAIAPVLQASYLLWPSKRRFSDANFGHVLGLPPDSPRVRRLALRAYREYAGYIVELMRLPSRTPEELVDAVEAADVHALADRWQASGRPLIIVAGHVGSNEAVGAALGKRGYPASVIADDSAFPELYELLRRQREGWGVRLIPWRNLRDLYGVLRRNEILALLIDWGYRSDGIPVRLFDAWTTLPSGPGALAARSGATIAALAIRRGPDGRYRIEVQDELTVPSSSPADLQRATQRIADALEATIAAAPEQWYSFKPLWPADPAESAELEARAVAMLAGRADPGTAGGSTSEAEEGDSTADRTGGAGEAASP